MTHDLVIHLIWIMHNKWCDDFCNDSFSLGLHINLCHDLLGMIHHNPNESYINTIDL
jgi:hypothetical protein